MSTLTMNGSTVAFVSLAALWACKLSPAPSTPAADMVRTVSGKATVKEVR